MTELQILLENEGLSKKEILIYNNLLQYGAQPASIISRLTKINRSQTYQILSDLQFKSLIFKQEKGGITYFFAKDPNIFINNLKIKQFNLIKLAQEVQKQLKDYSGKNENDHLVIQLYPGISGILDLLNQNSQYYNSEIKAIVGLEFYKALRTIRKDYNFNYPLVRKKNNIFAHAIYAVPYKNLDHLAQDRSELRKSYLLKPQYDCGLSLIIAKDQVSIFSVKDQVALCIKQSFIVQAAEKLFNIAKHYAKAID